MPSASSPLKLAVYLSAHGMGHAVRAAAVVEQLRQLLPIRVTVVAGCDRRIWPSSLTEVTELWCQEPVDAGVVQSDDVTVDLAATAARLARWVDEHPGLVQRESDRLRTGFDLVLGDVPSPAFDAAKAAGIRSVAVANFSWDWIYAELGFSYAAEVAAAGYACADLLLEASPFGPMAAFPHRIGVGLIARQPSQSKAFARDVLGLSANEAISLVAFQPGFASGIALPARREWRRYLVPSGWPDDRLRADVVRLSRDSRFEDAVMAADVVIGKPGYGLIGDVDAAGARFLYVPRPGFPENSVLVSHLLRRQGTAPLSPESLACGEWGAQLSQVESSPRPDACEADGAARAASEIAALLGVDSGQRPD